MEFKVPVKFKVPITGNKAGCTGCGEVFGTTFLFDQHRGHHRKPQREKGRCIPPTKFNLELRHGFWDTTANHDKREEAGKRLHASLRSSRTEIEADQA